MAAVAFFGKIRRAVGIAGIIGNTLAGDSARFVGQTRTAIYRAAAIIVPDAAQPAQRRAGRRRANGNALAGGVAIFSRGACAAIQPAAALIGNKTALLALRRTAFAGSQTPGGGFQHLAGSIERKSRGTIIVLAGSRVAGKSGRTTPAGRHRFPCAGTANRPGERILPILAALHALPVEPDTVAPAAIARRTTNFIVAGRACRASFAGGAGSRRARINRAITTKILIADKLARSLIAGKPLTGRRARIQKLVKPATAPAGGSGTAPAAEIDFPNAVAADRAGSGVFPDLAGSNAFTHIYGAIAPAARAGVATDSVTAISRTALPITGARRQIALIGENIAAENRGGGQKHSRQT